MKAERKLITLTTAVCLLPILAGMALYGRLPEQMPTHFDFSGVPNGWSIRPVAVFAPPCLMAALNVFLNVCLNRDPRRANMSSALRTICRWIIPALSVLCCGLTLRAALGKAAHAETILPLMLGILFVLIGNYLPKTKQSYTMGIRVRWTLESEENWNQTHRLAGFLWVIGGILLILLALLCPANGWLLGGLLLAMILIPVLFSYLLHKKGV